MRNAYILLSAFLLLCFDPAAAQSLKGAPIDPDKDGIAHPSDQELLQAPKNRYMITMSVPGDPSIKRGCTLSFDFDHSGKIENLQLLRSSGKPEVDFDCICAVLGSSPYEPNERGDRKNISYTFGGRDLHEQKEGVKAINRKQRNLLLSKSGLSPSEYYVCNLVPISILYRYPGVFLEEEICDTTNLRLIAKTFFDRRNSPSVPEIVANKRFRMFYNKWNDFISTHKEATKEEIEKFRDGVDSEFKDMFLTLSNSISKK